MEIPMKKLLFMLTALVISLAFANGHTAWADSEPGYYSASDQPDQNLLSPEELDDLLAPIALYPDPLIAQILPAATFIDQIDEAARYLRQYGRLARIDDQPWDLSVKAVAHYPDVLYMMDQKNDWTVSLGQAYLDQPQDVMESIQALRADAQSQGNLVSTPQQQIIVETGDIRIVPATPDYIYVPTYDPQVVYLEPAPSYGFITFGVGFTIGAWLSRDMDWRQHRVYYHGWRNTGGWVERSRPHIRDRRGIYINQRAASISTNRRVLQHDTNRFRQELHQDVQRRRELPGRPARPSRQNQPRPGRIDQQRPSADQQRPPSGQQRPPAAGQQRPPANVQQAPPSAGQQRPPSAGQQRPPAPSPAPAPAPAPQPPAAQRPPVSGTPGARDVFRGRDVQQTQPASRSGYGGYGSSKDATSYRERGQSSRENMRQGNRPAQQPGAAPAPKAPAAAAPPAPRPTAAPAPPAPRPAAAPAPPAARPSAAPAPRPHVPRPVMPAPGPAANPAPRPSGQERGGHEQR
jgi:hypothetical protein